MSLLTDREAMVSDTFFSEAVTYYPEGGGSLTIRAIVNRQPPQGVDFGRLHYSMAVTKSATTGILAPVVGKGKIGIKKHVGDASEAMARIDNILEQDDGGYTLLVSF